MAYRPDIDGLRAIAVLGVIFYHLIPGALPGGYVGVDIFFVISGYLIGGIIIEDTRAGTFSYVRFYTRRVKRLFAAYFVVAVLTVPFAWWLLTPQDFWSLGKSLVAATTFLSNYLFYREAGYFDASSSSKPLLHTWSLSVEEQFYIFFPLLMRVAVRSGTRWPPLALAVVGAATLVYSQHALGIDAAASYYSLLSRGWELLLGAAAALPQLRSMRVPLPLNRMLTWCSLLGLLLPMPLYSDATPFPGVAALPCCLGAAWLLWSGRDTKSLVQQGLSARALVLIGQMSYSLYLWHWPIYVFMNYYTAGVMRWIGCALALALTLVFGAFSWRFIEQPIRRARLTPGIVFGGALLGSALLVSLGYAIWRTQGFPRRLTATTRVIAQAAGDFSGELCHELDPTIPALSYCRIGAVTRTPEFLVWGDSHARAMRDGIDQLAKEKNVSGLLVFAGGCLPAFEIRKQESASGPRGDLECAVQNVAVKSLLAKYSSIKRVLLIGRWSYYTEGRGTGIDSQNTIRIEHASATQSTHSAPEDQASVVREAITATVRWLRDRGYKVYLLQQFPEMPQFSSRKLFQVLRSGHANLSTALADFGGVTRSALDRRQHNASLVLREASADSGVTVLSTHQLFCNERDCSAWWAGGPAYFDNNHLTATTARQIRDLFLPAITGE